MSSRAAAVTEIVQIATSLPPFVDPEHLELARNVEQFASQIASSPAEERDYVTRAKEDLRRIADAGLTRYTVPREYGGALANVDIRSLCVIRRGLAHYSALADAMFAMQGLGSYPITIAGSEQVKRRFLPRVASGHAIAAFAVTEPKAGSDAAGIESTARCSGHSYILDGTKRFISNAGIADFYVIFAKTGPNGGRKGISAFLVEKDTPGLTMLQQLELIAPHPIGEFRMQACRVPAENRLGGEGEGFSIMMRTMESFRTTVGAATLGLAERALQEATTYAQRRVQFGKALSEFQGLRFMLAEMATEVEASRLLVLNAAWKLDQALLSGVGPGEGQGAASGTLASSIAKLSSTEAAQRMIDQALQIHGGIGY
jgi:acyl-CoA dehydrogenase